MFCSTFIWYPGYNIKQISRDYLKPQKQCIWPDSRPCMCQRHSWEGCSTTFDWHHQDPARFQSYTITIVGRFATFRSFSQSSLTNVKYSRDEISCVFSTYLLYTLMTTFGNKILKHPCSPLPQVLYRSPQILASSWWTPRSVFLLGHQSKSQTCPGCPVDFQESSS